jgi:hypothetical protein
MSTLNIKATSGGIRGQADSGQAFDYLIDKDTFTALCGEVFDLCVKNASGDNKKSGGHVSQMLHAYGVTADRLEKYGESVFPEAGATWNDKNTEAWMEAMNFKAKREQKPLEERQKEWDAKAAALIAAGLNPGDFLSPKQRPVK